MSIQSSHIFCTSCKFESVLPSYPLTLIYQLPNGEVFETGPQFGWCHNCNGIRYTEPDFAEFFESEGRISELSRRIKSPLHSAKKVFDKLLGGAVDPDEQELNRLRLGLAIAKSRGSSPRCTVCWSDAPGNASSLEKHTCGGDLIVRPPLADAPRISYQSETLFLDFEGYRVGKFGPGDGYADLAARTCIDAVVQEGKISGFLVFGMFEKAVFEPMLSDTSIFRRFARIIEDRISKGDFDNPLSHITGLNADDHTLLISGVPRVLVALKHEPVSKWLRAQIISVAT